MAYFIFRERLSDQAIPAGAMVNFEIKKNLSDHHVADPRYESDYVYHEAGDEDEGAIDICVPGAHIIIWTISQMTGKSRMGQFFQLKVKDQNSGEWIPLSNGDYHLKTSSVDGFSTMMVYPNGFVLPGGHTLGPIGKVTFGLFNVSESPIVVNRSSHFKAAIVVFGSGTLGPLPELLGSDLADLQNRLALLNTNHWAPGDVVGLRMDMEAVEAEDNIQNQLLAQFKTDFDRVHAQFKSMSVPTAVTNMSSEIPGLGVSVLSTGYTHNFWSWGASERNVTMEADGEIYLAYSADYEPLSLYVGSATVGICYFEGPQEKGFMPVYFDHTGIYLKVKEGYAFLQGCIYRFTQALILSPPQNMEP